MKTAYAFMQAMGLINDHDDDCVIRAKVEADAESSNGRAGDVRRNAGAEARLPLSARERQKLQRSFGVDAPKLCGARATVFVFLEDDNTRPIAVVFAGPKG